MNDRTGDHGPDRSPWWREAREFLRDAAAVLGEVVRPPVPEPVLYLRCDTCGRVAPRVSERRLGLAQPECPCPLCGTFSPRVVGDRVDPDDPAVPAVTMVCDVRFGCWQFWRRCRCRAGFVVPAVAAEVMCPACGERYPGPGQ